MNQIEIFNSPEFGSIRIVEENGKYLFCGADVAKSLGYKDTVNALKTHCREDGVAFYHLTDNLGREQKAKFISEGNLYRLIVHSKLPSAERFEQWVFDEVLPTIRKHGAYLTKEKLWEVATSPEALLKLCSDLLAEREENVSLRIANAQLEVKPLSMTCSLIWSTAPISELLPKSLMYRNAALSDFFWKSVLCTALRPAMYCPMQSQPMKGCFV